MNQDLLREIQNLRESLAGIKNAVDGFGNEPQMLIQGLKRNLEEVERKINESAVSKKAEINGQLQKVDTSLRNLETGIRQIQAEMAKLHEDMRKLQDQIRRIAK